MFQDLIPIILLLGLAFTALAVAIILKLRTKKSLLIEHEGDFIDKIIERKKRKLNASFGGISWKSYTSLLLLCPIGLALLGYFLVSNKTFCVVFAFVGLFVPEIIIRIMAKKQEKKFEEKYAMALRSFASSLRAGLTIEQAIDNVGRNGFLDDAIRVGFKQIASDIKLGIPIEEAFQTFAKESGSKDAADVAAVISMQAKVGGSEAVAIGTVVQNISSRIMMRNEIKALFADTDILVLIMDIMPFIMFAVFYYGAPQMLEPFFESVKMTALLIFLLVFSTAGSFVIHKLSKSAKEG